ncbi:MAG: hypothetical protein Q9209_004717 [Squamulea sp. 1 TL-2023]
MAPSFTGLMELTESKSFSEGVKVDIVFIHGLDGDPKQTWTLDDCLWPQDLLTEDIPRVRVLTFGYDAQISSFWAPLSKSGIEDHADSLRELLVNARNHCPDRPIIFVAHSLGGVVCTEAILKASKYTEPQMAAIAGRTHGIAFLGTPHHGSDKTKWAEVARKLYATAGKTNKVLLEDLSHNSERLARIGKEFPHWLRNEVEKKDRKIFVMCFFEEYDTKIVGSQIVIKDEALIDGGYETMALPADHKGMCKCRDRNDAIYRAIIGILQRWVGELEKVQDEKPRQTAENISNSTWSGGTNHGQYIPQLIGAKGTPINFTNNASPKDGSSK